MKHTFTYKPLELGQLVFQYLVDRNKLQKKPHKVNFEIEYNWMKVKSISFIFEESDGQAKEEAKAEDEGQSPQEGAWKTGIPNPNWPR